MGNLVGIEIDKSLIKITLILPFSMDPVIDQIIKQLNICKCKVINNNFIYCFCDKVDIFFKVNLIWINYLD